MNELGARVRLVKGAYKEPASVGASRTRRTSTPPSVRLMRLLLDEGDYPAIATHDEAIIEQTRARTPPQRAIARDRFEFQMLYGIRRDLQASLVADGLPGAYLRPVRPRVVPLLHAPPGRTPGQHRLRPARHHRRAPLAIAQPYLGSALLHSAIRLPTDQVVNRCAGPRFGKSVRTLDTKPRSCPYSRRGAAAKRRARS